MGQTRKIAATTLMATVTAEHLALELSPRGFEIAGTSHGVSMGVWFEAARAEGATHLLHSIMPDALVAPVLRWHGALNRFGPERDLSVATTGGVLSTHARGARGRETFGPPLARHTPRKE